MFVDLQGYEGLYQISPQGEIQSSYRNQLLKGWVEKTGYRAVSLWKNGEAKRACVHVLLAKQFIPNPDNLPEVNHKDGVKLNNCLNNLEWSSGCSNVRHAFTNGLTKHGAILDYSKIPELLQEIYAGTPLVDLCVREGIKESSSLRKLLRREAERRSELDAFNKGTTLARKKVVQKQSKVVVQLSLAKVSLAHHPSLNEAARSISSNPGALFKALKSGKPYKNFFWEVRDA